MSNLADKRAIILGCSGTHLTEQEKKFYQAVNPFGFILFGRNIDNPDQVRALTTDLRDSVGDHTIPVLIDQEGGRVRRLRPPHWREAASMRTFGDLFCQDPRAAAEALHINITLMSAELLALGIDVDCAPVLDIPVEGSNDSVLGDRAFADEPFLVSGLGTVAVDAFLANGVLPVIKHIPGHGRAKCDSHHELPVVEASLIDLETNDFLPFRALNHAPLGMTAHIVYQAIDPEFPATTSEKIIQGIIREDLGFGGLLFSDDLSMKALSGSYKERAANSLAAGCDLVLHCNGDMDEMISAVEGTTKVSEETVARWEYAKSILQKPPVIDAAELEARLSELLN